MKQFGMNTYLYAPKDDVKHRAYWRDLYTVEEAGMVWSVTHDRVSVIIFKAKSVKSFMELTAFGL